MPKNPPKLKRLKKFLFPFFPCSRVFMFLCSCVLVFLCSCVFIAQAQATVELDYMEYATDAAARAAYVSSDVYSASDVTAAMTSNTAPSPNVVSADLEQSGY